jgi:membrane fusion protein (multidrug efflux system)
VNEQTSASGENGDNALQDRSRRDRLRLLLLVLVPLAFILGGLAYYLLSSRYESTENAYVDAGQVIIRAKVTGTVVSVEVKENQQVRKGDVLFRIKPGRFEVALAEAEAELARVRQEVGAMRASVGEGQAELSAARERHAFAQRELARQKQLLAEGIASQSQYDAAALAVREARERIASLEQQNVGRVARLGGNASLPVDQQAEVRAAMATLRQKQLDLEDTIVRAPQDGIVTKVHQLQVGDYVTASQPLFALVGTDVWIEANFKENQLEHMRVGQPVAIEIDAFPDAEIRGHIASFSPGTGNVFAVLPAENATGNWVKVVQRLPVQIALDKVPREVVLHAGLSAQVTVDTGAAGK